MSKLADKVAVVTGASKGIGAAIAKALAAEGAAVVVNYVASRHDADTVVAEITSKGGKALAIQGDVSKSGDVERLFADTSNSFGRIDILVNNAGIYRFALIESVTEDDFHQHFNINVLGVVLAVKEVIKHFGPDGGSIINLSTAVTRNPPPGASVYVASKSAIEAITRVLARELGPRKIRVNAISPGECRPRELGRLVSWAVTSKNKCYSRRRWDGSDNQTTLRQWPFFSHQMMPDG